MVWVDTPYLGGSSITAVSNTPLAATAVTYTLHLLNSGTAAANGISSTITFPDPLHIDNSRISATGGIASLNDQTIIWQGDLTPSSRVTITIPLTRTAGTRPIWYPTALILAEETTGTTLIEHRLELRPFEWFFPFVAQE